MNAQRWESLTFLHWRADPEVVQRWLPPGLTVDVVDSATWLGVVPFVMADVRVPPLPPLAGWSTFPELNVRVYVRDRTGTAGVWFLGLWCTRHAFVTATRAAGLPYHHARATVGTAARHAAVDAAVDGDGDGDGDGSPVSDPGSPTLLRYRFRATTGTEPFRVPYQPARHRPLRLSAEVRAHEEVDAASVLEVWLTARWNAYAVRTGALWRFGVHHEPWSLRRGTLDVLDTDLHTRLGLPAPTAEPLVHVAAPVHACFAVPRPVR